MQLWQAVEGAAQDQSKKPFLIYLESSLVIRAIRDYFQPDIGEELGGLLGDRCVQALGIQPSQAESYGKGAIVGEAGELEHAAAILHPKLGVPLRKAVEKGAALVPRSEE